MNGGIMRKVMKEALYRVDGVEYTNQKVIADKYGISQCTVHKRLNCKDAYSNWMVVRPARKPETYKRKHAYSAVRWLYEVGDRSQPGGIVGIYSSAISMYESFIKTFVETGAFDKANVVSVDRFYKRVKVAFKGSTGTIKLTVAHLKSLISKRRNVIKIDNTNYLTIPAALAAIIGDGVPTNYHDYNWVVKNVTCDEWASNYSMEYWKARLLRRRKYKGV